MIRYVNTFWMQEINYVKKTNDNFYRILIKMPFEMWINYKFNGISHERKAIVLKRSKVRLSFRILTRYLRFQRFICIKAKKDD